MVTRRVYDHERLIQFVTFSCFKRRRLLDPDRAKRIVIGQLGSQLAQRKGICTGFVIMPDHVHALIWFHDVEQISLLMDVWKTHTSLAIKELFQQEYPRYWEGLPADDPVWQPRYYGFNIWSRQKLEEKLTYMHLNPVRAGLVARTTDWAWSSARWYAEGKSVGLPILWPPGMETDDRFVVR